MATAVPRGHQCTDEADFTELLRWWFETTDEATVGDVGTFGGKPWVHVVVGDEPCHLNADTNRYGVRRYLDLVRAHPDGLPWSVIANTRGKVNRVALGPGREKVEYLYLYTDRDLSTPTQL